MAHTTHTTRWGIRIGGEWLSTDEAEGWTGDPERAREFASREDAEQTIDDEGIAAGLEDGLDDEIVVDDLDRGRRPTNPQGGFARVAFLLVIGLVLVVLGSIAVSAYSSITRFAESVSYPERVSRSIR